MDEDLRIKEELIKDIASKETQEEKLKAITDWSMWLVKRIWGHRLFMESRKELIRIYDSLTKKEE